MSGSTSLSWHDGSFFRGNLKNNVPEGKGTYASPQGKVYEGLWLNGFSYGLYRSWLEEVLQSDNYKFLLLHKLYLKMSDSFFDGAIAKLTRHDSPIDLSLTYTYGLRLIAFGEEILGDLRDLLCDDFAKFSQSNDAGDRAYSCGGRYPLPSDFMSKISELALSIENCNTLRIEILKIRSALDVYEKLMDSQSLVNQSPLGKSTTWNERAIFGKTLNKFIP